MRTKKQCVFCEAATDGKRPLCGECETLRQLIRSRSTRTVVRALEQYNARHRRHFTYGQFVNLCYAVEERRQKHEKEKRKAKESRAKAV